ncbi:DUF4158 domain-containing protein [Microtetraspora malaysiensis]|uniref:DUF4158 domain-containing protein n=1 Tax=Microtetraspora malaysiensis TaxID=161358 RepID=UPI003D8D02D3
MISQGLEGYGRFGSLSRVELERFFHLDDEDRRLIGKRRGDHSCLGFALQVVTVRHLGMFLADPLDVPVELVDYLAEQLGVRAPPHQHRRALQLSPTRPRRQPPSVA